MSSDDFLRLNHKKLRSSYAKSVSFRKAFAEAVETLSRHPIRLEWEEELEPPSRAVFQIPTTGRTITGRTITTGVQHGNTDSTTAWQ